MADKTIGDLPAALAIYDDDLFLLEQSGEAKNLRGALYKAYLQGFVDAASAASEEAAAALAGVRDAINNIPEGAATPIVNDLTTGGTSMALSAEMGKKLKGELDTRVNPNLLDNWYFGNPVNQRGKTEYTGAGYNIDRWAGQSAETVVKVTESGITIAGNGATGYLRQPIEHQKQYLGKEVTLSVLFADGELVESTGLIPLDTTDNTQHVCVTRTYNDCYITLSLTASGRLYTQFRCSADTSTEIQAVKLELGTQQTLAHQDANGNWVLNEIPDYNEQLLRCCMSTADSSDTYANNKRTPAAINAVNKAGDTMTGALIVDSGTGGNTITAKRLVNDEQHSVAMYPSSGGVGGKTAPYFAYTRANNPVAQFAFNETGAIIRDVIGEKEYNILHTGNKPSGRYTGNGSTEEWSIDIGGVGGLLLVSCSNNGTSAIVTPYGAVPLSNAGGGTTITAIGGAAGDRDGARFTSAGLYVMKTAHPAINENGFAYDYRVI